MVDMSRMPDRAMFSVRGMGVADRVSTSTPLGQLLELLLVADAEALLLVHDQQAQVLELHVFLQQLVGADDQVHAARVPACRRVCFCCVGVRKRREHVDVHREAWKSGCRAVR